MPFYKYRCKHCDDRTDHLLKVDDRKIPTKDKCEKCGEFEIVQVVGCTNIISGLSENHHKPTWFTDKIKEMKKDAGKGNTLDHAL